jgi:signal transduction histidine kinase
MKTELISMISHELRTPLTALQGFSELLLTRENSPEEVQLWMETIHTEATRLGEMLDALLQVSRLEGSGIQLRVRPIALGQTIRAIVADFPLSSPTHRLMVEADHGDEVQVQADPDRLAEIVGSLLSNAVKYSPGGGTVRVSLGRAGDWSRVSVQDEGLGIPPEHQARLFTRFYRVDTPDRAAIRGTGLGLYLANQLVERQGGKMSVESAVGRGSTFSFTLPLASEDARPAEVTA